MSKVTMKQAHRSWEWKPQSDSRNAIIASNAIVSLEGGSILLKRCKITAAHKVKNVRHKGKVISVKRVNPGFNVWIGSIK